MPGRFYSFVVSVDGFIPARGTIHAAAAVDDAVVAAAVQDVSGDTHPAGKQSNPQN